MSHSIIFLDVMDDLLVGGVFLLCIPEMQVRKRISECLAGPREWIYLSPGAISKEERVTNTLGERSTT